MLEESCQSAVNRPLTLSARINHRSQNGKSLRVLKQRHGEEGKTRGVQGLCCVRVVVMGKRCGPSTVPQSHRCPPNMGLKHLLTAFLISNYLVSAYSCSAILLRFCCDSAAKQEEQVTLNLSHSYVGGVTGSPMISINVYKRRIGTI